MIYGIGSESSSYIAKFKELGIRTMFNADYLETDPLGKAEWIRVFGALYCKQEMADSLYGEIQKKYLDLKTFIEHNIKNHPKVLLGLPFRDTWFISPGNSYISELINDAGGDYLWSSTQSPVSMPVGIEAVFLKAMEADYWLNTGSATTPEEIISIDSRLAGLPCFSDGNLYNNIKRVSTDGGNDYWEGGCLFPDIILRDIASILHPDLFPGNDLYYYQKLE
jgi:iron complex transport system substrate-binding protein